MFPGALLKEERLEGKELKERESQVRSEFSQKLNKDIIGKNLPHILPSGLFLLILTAYVASILLSFIYLFIRVAF